MPPPIDETGNRYGRLLVQAPAPGGNGKRRWRCKCDCGAIVAVVGGDLRSGRTTSCGCRRRETSTRRATTHGESNTRLYRVWASMIQRCRNPADPSYRNYGGRGIRISSRWTGLGGFANFRSDMGDCPPGLMLERIDNNGDYTSANCRWATSAEQRANQRRSLDEETVLAIRAAHLGGASIAAIARMYGRSWSGIARIVRRETWRHI